MDHKSLRELLTQVIQTPEQQHFLRKLMGYQFSIEYKVGTENSAIDTLSRRHENHSLQVRVAVLVGKYDFLDDLVKENPECADLKMLHKQQLDGTLDSTHYCSRNGLLLYKNSKKCRDIQFKVGDLVLVRLQPYYQSTVVIRLNYKLCCRYFGPFSIIALARLVAYTLVLLAGSKIHPTFLLSLMKPFKGDLAVTCYPLPKLSHASRLLLMLIAILAGRIAHIQGKPQKQVLVQWSHSSLEDATCEELHAFSNLKSKP
ncbi:hypothetical protein FEM48_ZijujUnG0095800 [Ziziphus jujuba var. spinosa]|uniref:Tf2-1-like SH3-like domain-containing protein n=1 Tax=Ziziphus jujuba var. spinosa TaxID=714518 RepID=A0A978U8E5_ZIZJJ|nr:hypothetical protein FEM48_ZijujUnG0095800 [Ziziphus jujuba var. spinosa]